MRTIYTILVNKNNELITTTKERIMQKSKLVDFLHFLVDPNYKGKDISTFTVLLEYSTPVTHEYHSEFLTLSGELYQNMLEYKLPFDTNLTKEAGDIELQLTFSKVELNYLGKPIQMVRKTSTAFITVTPIAAWSDFVPDGLLTPLDQRILAQQAQIQQLEEIANTLDMTKADDLSYVKDKLQLTANGKKIGTPVTITSGGSSGGDEGYDIVEF